MNKLTTSSIEVEINDATDASAALLESIQAAVRSAAAKRQFFTGSIGVAIVDDHAIQTINREHLQHDYPTDVISFAYAEDPPHVEGELVISRETAHREAEELGWPPEHEILLYVIHGTLHICGMEDQTPAERLEMRQAECSVLAALGIENANRYGADGPMDAQPRGPN